MKCRFLVGMLLAGHATADSNEAIKKSKVGMSKFMAAQQMPRPVAQGIKATPVSDGMQSDMLQTLADMELLEAQNQEMQAEYQRLQARIQKMPRAGDQAWFGSAASFGWLAGFIASVGLAASVGVASLKKYAGNGQISTSDSQISLAAAGPSLSFTTRAAPIKMQLTGRAYAETLPGVTAPMGFWDPLGLLDDRTNESILMFREAELAHARVAMVGALGFLVQENFHPIFPEIGGPAARQLDVVLQTSNGQGIMASLLFGVMLTEIHRAKVGWKDPEEEQQALRPEYTPGEIGFDPLGMAPKTESGMLAMKNKELNNGRLAMIAIAGICAQEVITGTV